MPVETMQEKVVYDRPRSLADVPNHYCPGCGHGIIHKLLAQCIDELGIQDSVILVAPVGCSVLAYNYLRCDGCEAAHGRAPAVATGIKRVHPDRTVISYQGDGDLLAIGTAETIHAANRGEKITVIFVNNAIYGMTGGQMAPTSLQAQKTKTSPYGRNPADVGFPIRACELLNTLQSPVFIERCAVTSVKTILKTKKAIMKGLRNQVEGKGYSFIEILSMCPTGWGMEPREAVSWVESDMVSAFPLGNLKRPVGGRMYEGIFFPGFGGQGIILAGKIVCLAAMGEGKHVTHIPSYGAEMRGGTANCSVVVSDEEIASPLVPRPDVCVVMNTPSLLKFQSIVRPGGLLIWNESLIDTAPERTDIEILPVRANDIAEAAGSYRSANMVMLGALLKRRPSVASMNAVLAVLEEAVSARHRELNQVNRKALAGGYETA